MLNNRMGKVLAERGAVGYKYCRRTAATRMDRMHTPLGTHMGSTAEVPIVLLVLVLVSMGSK